MIVGLLVGAFSWYESRPTRLGRRISACPLGHNALRVVPVVYGLRNPDAEELHKLETHELVAGGCALGVNSPAYHAYCDACGYEYDPEFDCWERRNATPVGFAAGFSPIITAFPVPKNASTQYLQQIRNGLRVWQHVSSRWEAGSERDFEDTAKVIEANLHRQSLQFGISTPTYIGRYPNASNAMEFGLLDGDSGTTGSTITLVYYADPPTLSADLSIYGPGEISTPKGRPAYETICDKYHLSQEAREQLGGG